MGSRHANTDQKQQKKQEEKHNKEVYVLFMVKKHTCSL